MINLVIWLKNNPSVTNGNARHRPDTHWFITQTGLKPLQHSCRCLYACGYYFIQR